VTLSLGAGAPLLSILAGRYVLGVIARAPIAGAATLSKTPGPLRNALIFRAGLLQAAFVFSSGASLRWLNAATLVFLFYTYPAWVTLIVAMKRNERLTMRRALALLLSLAGVTIMVGAPGPSSVHPLGTAFALASALLFAIYLVYTHGLQASLAPGATAFWIALGAGGTFLVAAIIMRDLTISLTPAVWIHLVTLGAVSTALGYWFFFLGLQELGAVRTAIVSTVEPIWAALLGWLVLAQPVTLGTAVGGLCIAAAVVMLQWPQKRAAVPIAPPAT
jgi:drug/metabolite transporter (DMT)-like permease